MTQGVKDLINAIVEGDASSIDAAFNAEMANRVSAKLEDMRIRVAQNIFKTEQVEVAEEVESEDEEVELTEEEVDEILDSITEEDMAEIDSEEEQVDEATLSAKAARAGKDIGKPGKNFAKIAKKAGEKYGSAEKGAKVAGAILAKMRAKHGV
jgi:division protein CdvB (Snf7/Vps24/ESCRT-III family)